MVYNEHVIAHVMHVIWTNFHRYNDLKLTHVIDMQWACNGMYVELTPMVDGAEGTISTKLYTCLHWACVCV